MRLQVGIVAPMHSGIGQDERWKTGPAVPAAPALPAAVAAFDAAAEVFDARFGEWASVAAQRRAVRRYLLRAFPEGARLLELGGGTGEDALYLGARGRRIHLTDGAPRMVACARAKAGRAGLAERVEAEPVALEALEAFARAWRARGGAPFDGAYSNFAALNCVDDLRPVGRGLAALIRPGGAAVLVMFGPLPPGEVIVQLVRGDRRAAFRRLSRGGVPARLGGHHFTVRYPGPERVARALGPYFRLERIRGIGVFVPPSAAEPEISRFPRLVAVLEWLDRFAAAPFALLGDHVLLHLVRTGVAAPGAPAGVRDGASAEAAPRPDRAEGDPAGVADPRPDAANARPDAANARPDAANARPAGE